MFRGLGFRVSARLDTGSRRAFVIRIGFWWIIYCSCNTKPSNCIGNHLDPHINPDENNKNDASCNEWLSSSCTVLRCVFERLWGLMAVPGIINSIQPDEQLPYITATFTNKISHELYWYPKPFFLPPKLQTMDHQPQPKPQTLDH